MGDAMKNKKRNKVFLLMLIILGLSIGFAALSATLKINGTSTINKNTWNIYWDNIANQSGVTPVTPTTISDESTNIKKNIVNFTVEFDKPGDFYEFEVDAVNAGTLDAMIVDIDSKINGNSIISTENGRLVVADPSPVPSFIDYSITYADGTELGLNHLLAKADTSTTPITKTRETYKIRVEYSREKVEVSDLANETLLYEFSFAVTYGQSDDSAIDRNASPMNLGDYFTLVPDVDDYTVPTGLTGYENSTGWYSQDTIHPSELTLWRVIDIHQDGTVDAVSEYTSSTKVLVYGLRGYENFVGGLQTIASQYAKAGYTVGARSMGYDGQTLTIQDTSSLSSTSGDFHNYSNTMEYDSVGPVTGTGSEVDGGLGGDTLYLKDIQLVGNVYKSDTATYGDLGLKASVVGTSDYDAIYWVASRGYIKHNDFEGFYGINCNGTRIGRTANLVQRNDGGVFYNSDWYYIRPIITLKKGLKVDSGTGTLNDPYIFE